MNPRVLVLLCEGPSPVLREAARLPHVGRWRRSQRARLCANMRYRSRIRKIGHHVWGLVGMSLGGWWMTSGGAGGWVGGMRREGGVVRWRAEQWRVLEGDWSCVPGSNFKPWISLAPPLLFHWQPGKSATCREKKAAPPVTSCLSSLRTTRRSQSHDPRIPPRPFWDWSHF